MPTAMVDAQAVLAGKKLYAGGKILYSTELIFLNKILFLVEKWTEIETPLKLFSMAVVNNQLIIAGGELIGDNDDAQISNKVLVLDSSTDTWVQPFPEMLAPRRFSFRSGLQILG